MATITEYGVSLRESQNWRGGKEWHLYCTRCHYAAHAKRFHEALRVAHRHAVRTHTGHEQEANDGNQRVV